MFRSVFKMFVRAVPEIDIDLKGDPQVRDNHKEAFSKISQMLAQSNDLIDRISHYKGCQELAKKAMENKERGSKDEQAAFNGLLVAVDSIERFFDFCNTIVREIPPLLQSIASCYDGKSVQDSMPQALMKLFVVFVAFAIKFDSFRMSCPHLANDFSYYRRLLPRYNKHPNLKVGEDKASKMGVFTGDMYPMVNSLIKASGEAMKGNNNVGLVWAMIANSCLKAVKENRYDGELKLVCGRAMTGAIVVFDHIADPHAFHKKSPIKTRELILMLKSQFAKEVVLQNFVRFCTKHFSEAASSTANLLQ